jgi:hypothetical protein
VAACTNPGLPDTDNTVLFDSTKGLVLVSLSGTSAAADSVDSRSVIPALDQGNFGYMLYWDTEDPGLENGGTPFSPGSAVPLELGPAHWKIRVKAWEGDVPGSPDAEVPAFEGSAELDVSAGKTTSLAIAVKPVQIYQASEDTVHRKILTPTRFGTFEYSVTFTYDADGMSYPADLNYAQLYIYPLRGTLYYEQPLAGDAVPLESNAVYPIKGALAPLEEGVPIMLIDLLRGAVADGNNKKAEASVSLPVGFYRITTQLNRTDSATQKYAGETEVIAVYKGEIVADNTAYAVGSFSALTTTGSGQREFSTIWGTTATTLQGFLAGKPQNTRDTPYLVAINNKLDGTVTNAGRIGPPTDPLAGLFNVLQGRYVIYDLSKCTAASNIIPDVATNYDDPARVYADRITGIILPSTITTIGVNTFARCSSLTQITLPADLTTIKSYAFYSCSSLESLVLPAGVTTLDGSGMFSSCSSLTSVDIPVGVGNIPANTFSNCTALQSVTLRKSDGAVTLANVNAFTSALYVQKPDFAIYVPETLISTYEAASNWSTMNTNWKTGTGNSEGSIFRAIP